MDIFVWGAIGWASLILVMAVAHLARLWLNRTYPPTAQFSVVVVVPCKGNDDPDFENNLRNIVQQQYAGPVQYLFCVESEQDSALPILRYLEQRFERVRVCVAGLATRCAQKTFNVLRGMECAGEVDIFVIADADIQPHPTWLQELVAPFADPTMGVTTGFFRRTPMAPGFRWGDYIAGILGSLLVTGVSDNLVKGVWGGSLAIRKAVMDRYGLYERFASEIVDDIVVMHALHTHRIKRHYVQSCTLKSYCDMSVAETVEWFVRQIQFSQIYFKLLYAIFYVVAIPYALSFLVVPFVLMYGLVYRDVAATGASLLFLVLVALAGAALYKAAPVNPASVAPEDSPYRLSRWIVAMPVAFLFGVVALLKTAFRVRQGVLTMHWRRITYHADVQTGKVREVLRDGEVLESEHSWSVDTQR